MTAIVTGIYLGGAPSDSTYGQCPSIGQFNNCRGTAAPLLETRAMLRLKYARAMPYWPACRDIICAATMHILCRQTRILASVVMLFCRRVAAEAMPVQFMPYAKERGRDTSYRTRKRDTHLTHGCIQLFRHFWGQRCGSAWFGRSAKPAFPTFSKAADWHRRRDER